MASLEDDEPYEREKSEYVPFEEEAPAAPPPSDAELRHLQHIESAAALASRGLLAKVASRVSSRRSTKEEHDSEASDRADAPLPSAGNGGGA